MPKSGVITVLVAMQLLCWSVQPLYLCLGNDGAVDVCLGPGHCECCEKAHLESEHGCCPDDCGRNRSHQPTVAQLSDPNSCDCTHIQISQPQNPTVVGKTVQADSQARVFLSVSTTVDSLTGATADVGLANRFSPTFLWGNALPLAQLATVALRC
jgi:hypothetical protein